MGSLLGLEQAVTSGNDVGAELDLTFEEFVARFPAVEIDGDTIQHAVRLGLIELTETGVRIPDSRFLDIGAEIAHLGVPPADLLDEWEHVEAAAKELAARFRAAFEARVWGPFVEAGIPGDQLDDVTKKLERMQQLGQEIVAIALAEAIKSEANDAITAAATRVTHGALPTPDSSGS